MRATAAATLGAALLLLPAGARVLPTYEIEVYDNDECTGEAVRTTSFAITGDKFGAYCEPIESNPLGQTMFGRVYCDDDDEIYLTMFSNDTCDYNKKLIELEFDMDGDCNTLDGVEYYKAVGDNVLTKCPSNADGPGDNGKVDVFTTSDCSGTAEYTMRIKLTSTHGQCDEDGSWMHGNNWETRTCDDTAGHVVVTVATFDTLARNETPVCDANNALDNTAYPDVVYTADGTCREIVGLDGAGFDFGEQKRYAVIPLTETCIDPPPSLTPCPTASPTDAPTTSPTDAPTTESSAPALLAGAATALLAGLALFA